MEETNPETTIPLDDTVYKLRRIDGKLWLPPRGNPKGKLMLILSHPGHEDLQAANLLSGDYKDEIQSAVSMAGIDPNEVYITTMVKYGIGNKSKPSAEQIEQCAPILDFEIQNTQPKLIMTLGAEVFKRIMKTKRKQSDSLGELVDSPYGKLLPNYSPGMILNQDPKKRPAFRDIFEYAKRYLDDNIHYTPFRYMVVSDPALNRELIEMYIKNEMFSVGYDLEWYGDKFTDDEVVYTFQYCCDPHVAVILDISPDGITENRELLDTMKPLLEHEKSDHLGWNLRADRKRLILRGFNLAEKNLGFDGMKACAFFDSRMSKALDTGIKKFTNYEPYYVEFNEAKVKHKLKDKEIAKIKLLEPDIFYKYCAGDAVAHREACVNMRNKMKTLPQVQQDYYFDVYLPLSDYLMDLEMSGISIDLEVMEDLTNKYTGAYNRLLTELHTYTKKLGYDTERYESQMDILLAQEEKLTKDEAEVKLKETEFYEDFNPASAPQKKQLLFSVLGLNPAYYTKAGKSPKPRVWYNKQRPQVKSQYSPSTNSKSLATLKFELTEEVKDKPEVQPKLDVVRILLDLTRVGVFANKFLNKKGTDFVVDEEEEEGEVGLKASYWNAICKDGKIHPDFFECLANFRSSSTPNVQNPASKVLSHIPEIFVPGYSKMDKETKKLHEKEIPRNIRHIFYTGHKDWYWAEVDVAGADLMIAAYLSRDPDYITDMLSGGFHIKKAREYFRDDSISKDDYSKYVSAKSITFRVAYTSQLMCAAIPIQAEIFAESGIYMELPTIEYALGTWERYKKYMEFREKCKAQVEEYGYIENMRGIRYYFEESDNFGIKAGWLNESLAYPIASSLAQFLWTVSVEIKHQLEKDKLWMNWCYPVNSVHDASYWSVHKDLMKDNYFPEVCRYYFTQHCKIETGDRLGMEMVVAERWKGKEEVFHNETKWDFVNKQWNWK